MLLMNNLAHSCGCTLELYLDMSLKGELPIKPFLKTSFSFLTETMTMNTPATISSKIKQATITEAQTIRQNAQGRGQHFIMHVKSYFGIAVIVSCSKYKFGCFPGSQTPSIGYCV